MPSPRGDTDIEFLEITSWLSGACVAHAALMRAADASGAHEKGGAHEDGSARSNDSRSHKSLV
jgi:hypothetical protein